MVTWQPQPDDYHRILIEQNPWHSTATVPTVLAPATERSLALVLWKKLIHHEPRRHQVILGPRRVGKTTVLYQTVRHLIDNGIAPNRIWWLRMDHPMLLDFHFGDLVKIVLDISNADQENPLFLMLDEIVYARNWDLWLKTFHDEAWPIRIAATCSSTTVLRSQRHESGVGRWEEHHLLPCNLDEFFRLVAMPRSLPTGDTLASTLESLPSGTRSDTRLEASRMLLLLVGGFPELLTRLPARVLDSVSDSNIADHILESQRVLRSDAVERAVYKDIPQTSGVGDPIMLERLLYLLAGQVASLMSPTNISRQLGITQPTLDRYLSYLQQSYLVFTLTNYSGNEARTQRRGRKLYFTDGAVRNAALHRGLAPLSDPVEQGTLLENLAASSVNTLAAHTGVGLHYWRDSKHEVDLIYDDLRQPLAFEIASSPDHNLKGLRALIKHHPRLRYHSYLVAPQVSVIHPSESGSDIGTIPLGTFLLTVGAQTHHAAHTRIGRQPSQRAASSGSDTPCR